MRDTFLDSRYHSAEDTLVNFRKIEQIFLCTLIFNRDDEEDKNNLSFFKVFSNTNSSNLMDVL